jgi:hypothetical protein
VLPQVQRWLEHFREMTNPNTSPVEYTRGTGLAFPSMPTLAQNTTTGTSTTTGGTTPVQALPQTGTVGQLVFLTTTNTLYVYTGVTWKPV